MAPRRSLKFGTQSTSDLAGRGAALTVLVKGLSQLDARAERALAIAQNATERCAGCASLCYDRYCEVKYSDSAL